MSKILFFIWGIMVVLFIWACLGTLHYLMKYKYKSFFLKVICFIEAHYSMKRKRDLIRAEAELYILRNESEQKRLEKQRNEYLNPKIEEVTVLPGDLSRMEWEVKNSEGKNKNYITIDVTHKAIQK